MNDGKCPFYVSKIVLFIKETIIILKNVAKPDSPTIVKAA